MVKLLILIAVLAGLCLYIHFRKPELPVGLEGSRLFRFKALTIKRKEFASEIRADTKEEALEKIRRLDLFPTEISEIKE